MRAKKIDSKFVHQTPVGISVYPKLIEPDTEFDPVGRYFVGMKFQPEDECQMSEKLDAMYEAAYHWNCEKENKPLKRADKPWHKAKDADCFIFNFKSKAGGVSADGKPWQRRPPLLFDADGPPVPEEERRNLRI